MNKAIKALKNIFIPHEHNGYKPHFFRELSIASIVLVAVVLFSISAGTNIYIKNTNITATVLPAVLVDLTNTARVDDNEQALTRNSILDQAALLKAQDMASRGYFSHTSPQGITPWYWFDKAGYYFSYAGENLAINFNQSNSVENAWLNSPTHRANILNSHFTEIGIAAVDGTYQGNPTTYIVQLFGTPAIPTSVVENKIQIVTPTKKTETTTPKTSTTLAVDTPLVKGESIVNNESLETITNTKDFIAVKNNDASSNAQVVSTPDATHYSSWFDRFMFMTPSYTDFLYKIFIYVVIVALLLMTFIEIRTQHLKNIIYGIFLLAIMICLLYINKSMFITYLI